MFTIQSEFRYEIVRKIFEGGMGVVFRAERNDGEFSRQVAIKLISGRQFAPEADRRFEDLRIRDARDPGALLGHLDQDAAGLGVMLFQPRLPLGVGGERDLWKLVGRHAP